MSVLKSFAIAFSMYSRVPMPQFVWKDEDMRYVMCFFPLVGVVQGGTFFLLCFLRRLSFMSGVSDVVFAAAVTALPVLVTGGIHMDGFLDTVDARHSYGDREKKLQILKDPHAGAFAILYGGLYLAVSFALAVQAVKIVGAVGALGEAGAVSAGIAAADVAAAAQVTENMENTVTQVAANAGNAVSAGQAAVMYGGLLKNALCGLVGGDAERFLNGIGDVPDWIRFATVAGLLPVLSRGLSAASLIWQKSAKHEGLVYTFASKAQKKTVRAVNLVTIVAAAAVMILISPVAGVCTVTVAFLVYLYYIRMAKREFGGITGDLAGYFLCICELMGFAAAVLL